MTMVDFSRAVETTEQPPAKGHRTSIIYLDGGYYWCVAQHRSGGEYKQSPRFKDFASALADLNGRRKERKFPLSFL